jgi:glyoxylase-like metal-dependent hydrolase (beta-lactamase superfamily II)
MREEVHHLADSNVSLAVTLEERSMLTNRRTIMTGALAVGAAAMTGPMARAAAPMQGISPANVHRYMVGGFEVTALLDFARPGDKPEATFGTNQKPEDVAALLQANFLPADKFVNMFTPIVVNTGKELVLFDTGLGAANGGQLQERLKAAGFAADQIDVVVITHCHPDHIGGVATDGKANFPNARYVIGETEYGFWSNPERMSGPTENAAKLVAANVTPFKDKMTFLKNESEVVSGIRALDAAGHTPGHMAFHIESNGKRILLGADFCNHYVLSLQRPDWEVRFDADKAGAAATRVKYLDMLAADKIPFTSYHMPFPSVGFVDKTADGGYRYVPATYQLML